jgi:hypothetical protein
MDITFLLHLTVYIECFSTVVRKFDYCGLWLIQAGKRKLHKYIGRGSMAIHAVHNSQQQLIQPKTFSRPVTSPGFVLAYGLLRARCCVQQRVERKSHLSYFVPDTTIVPPLGPAGDHEPPLEEWWPVTRVSRYTYIACCASSCFQLSSYLDFLYDFRKNNPQLTLCRFFSFILFFYH